MIFEMTIQIRVTDIEEGHRWYETLLKKKPELIPHEGFVEWELLPGCWLQVAEGTPSLGSGPLRIAVKDIEAEKVRVMKELDVENFEIFSREEVSAKWGTFIDHWGNQIGFFEYLNKHEQKERIKTVLGLTEE
ncbi:VOC family protein [Psychrobacillus vulpis]|uniref:VOC family protein n=1 Tax=Psychrobacillus vulpis TaxID=2325572 RepID=A0A544TPY3_9BACI|nr:VOC family protein [Psychrobacillus vulpis]TQR19465.1 VOC family protein [Psychrobacillus vulpis]